MNDQLLMGERNGGTNLAKQFQYHGFAQILLTAKFVNARAFDVFHHEKRRAFVGRATVQKACDVRVIQ